MSLRDQLEKTRCRWRARERSSSIEDERCALDFAQRLALLCADRRCMPRVERKIPSKPRSVGMTWATDLGLKVVVPVGSGDGPVITMEVGSLVIETGHTCRTMLAAVELLRLAAANTMVSPGWSLHFLGLAIELAGEESEVTSE